jgi:hypothetical protein
VIVFYGICFEHDSADAAKFQSEDVGESEGENSLAWMAANLYRESRDGVEFIHYGHYDYRHFGIAVAGTVQYGQSWAALPLRIPTAEDGFKDVDAGTVLSEFCQKHGLTFEMPTWYAVPYYG